MNNSTNNAIRFPRFLFPLLYRAKRAEHKNIFLRFIISRIRGNDCCCCVKSYNNNNLHSEFFFFYPFAFILYNFFTRYIYISKFLFFFPPRNLLKGNKAGGLWQVLIDPDLNLIILFWDGSLPIEISELIPDEDIILAY